MPEIIRIVIVDDHSVVRQGIKSLLSEELVIDVVGEAADGVNALRLIQNCQPDVILLDIRLGRESGLDVLTEIKAVQPDAKVLMLTSFDDEEYVMQALELGAMGYMLKQASDELLINGICAVYDGQHMLSPAVTGQVVRRLFTNPFRHRQQRSPLSAEEKQLIDLMTDGASNSQIAQELYMSPTTVKRKLSKIFEKMNVNSRAQHMLPS